MPRRTPARPRTWSRVLLVACCLLAGLALQPIGAPSAGADVDPLVFPVAGGASWTDTFGAPRVGHTHAGEDLFAPKMRPLVSTVDGVVDRMGRSTGISGNYVVINNDRPGTDDGANLDLDAFPPGIYPGAKVFSGQTIGYLGDSGNAETTPPHLHFEIRLPDGTPINPTSRLQSAVQYTLDPRLVAAHSPFGGWDSTVLSPGGFMVSGWGIDPNSSTSLVIEAYVDRNRVRTFTADEPRADLAEAYPDKGPLHGFDDVVPTPDGTHQICLAVRNDDRGPASMYGCRTVSRSTSPVGTLDAIVRVPGALRLSGWTIDSDTTDPTDVHGYIDQSGVAVVASQPRPDLAASYPLFGTDHGYTVEVPVAPGRHDVCSYGINAAADGGTSVLACRSVQVSSDPVGRLDAISGGPGQITLSGWSLDPDTVAPTDIHVYVDGVGTNLGPAAADRGDIAAAYPGWGSAHGFTTTLPVSRGGDHQVCTYAINLSYGSNVLLGCTTVRTPTGSPVGVAEVIQRIGTQVRVAGWAIDPDTASPVDIHVYVGGQGTNLGPADADRPDLAPYFPGYGTNHGFDRLVSIPTAPTQACVYAIDRVGGQPPRLLGCSTV
jgi:hypothetical protein